MECESVDSLAGAIKSRTWPDYEELASFYFIIMAYLW
jgi:hypothetical protein